MKAAAEAEMKTKKEGNRLGKCSRAFSVVKIPDSLYHNEE